MKLLAVVNFNKSRLQLVVIVNISRDVIVSLTGMLVKKDLTSYGTYSLSISSGGFAFRINKRCCVLRIVYGFSSARVFKYLAMT